MVGSIAPFHVTLDCDVKSVPLSFNLSGPLPAIA
jgi:hypothetical protein